VNVERPTATPEDERLYALDILRGLALVAMIVVHVHQKMQRDVAGIEDLIAWGVWVLLEQKAWGTFAFLFGAGFAILLRRLDARRAPVVPIYLRRLGALAVFGIIATVGFGFHILFEYACWGVVLLLIRRRSTPTLLVAAALFASVRPLAAEVTALHAWWTSGAVSAPASTAFAQLVADAAKQHDYAALLSARWALFVHSYPQQWRDLLPTVNLALFTLGLLAVRHRVLDEPGRHVRLIAGWMIFGVCSWAAAWLVLNRLPATGIPGADWPIAYGFGVVQDQWLCFTYIGAVVLLVHKRPRWNARLAVFAEVGRMALTNYMVQAIVLDALASGYGAGMKVRPFLYPVVAALLFGGEAAVSRAWLARFRFGPLEWVWRTITYARAQPLRRSVPGHVAV
jgi:uncharacterized protein